MMDWSDKHCRYFWRLLTKKSLLYTEMVVSGALIHGDRKRFLDFDPEEHPLALQVGGSEPEELAQCAKFAQEWGYDEINLNCGCPSDRVQSGRIGAILMTEPELVARCVEAMAKACDIPVTVKHRIGVDDMDDYPDMYRFVSQIADAGCQTFIVHARKAWLKGLSPKQNREVPPLKYEHVYQLKRDFPQLNIIINGGITTVEQSKTLLQHVDGVMIGREAYNNPFFLADIDQALFDVDTPKITRHEVIESYIRYCDTHVEQGQRLHHMSRHILGLYLGQPRARLFRRHVTENANKPGATTHVLREAMTLLDRDRAF